MELSEADKMLLSAKTAEETKKALEMGANVNAKNRYKDTALMLAKTTEQTKLLLEAGSDPNLKDDEDCTALMEILRNAWIPAETKLEQTKLLIAAGADVNAKGRYFKRDWVDVTPLSFANKEQFLILLEAGASLKDMGENCKLSIAEIADVAKKFEAQKEARRKIAMNKEHLKNKARHEGKSGVVIADKIAEKKISGEEKRDITPKVGKELRTKIMKEMKSKGK